MYQHILVPVDGSPTSTLGLDEAIKLAKLSGGRIRLVHVLDGLMFVTGLEYCTADLLGLIQEAGEEILHAAKAHPPLRRRPHRHRHARPARHRPPAPRASAPSPRRQPD